MRYPHVITPVSGGKWPRRVVMLDCIGFGEQANATPTKVTDSLSQWHACLLTLSDDKYGVVRTECGKSASHFWAALEQELCSPGGLWLFSYQCGRVWSMMDAWRLIETRQLRIVGRDEYGTDEPRESLRKVRLTQADQLATVGGNERRRLEARQEGMLVVADPPCMMTARLGRGQAKLIWVDVRNYAVGIPDHVPVGSKTCAYMVEWFLGYHHACVTLNLGSLQLTVGGQAYHGYRSGYYQGGIYCGGRADNVGVARSGHHGARSECFSHGRIESACWHHDTRSAYAYHSALDRIPQWLDHCVLNPSLSAAARCNEDYACIATVDIETSEPAYPYRRRKHDASGQAGERSRPRGVLLPGDTDLIFPVGRFTTTLPGPELTDALDKGRVHKVHAIECYHGAALFSDYMRALYDLRCALELTRNPAMLITAKALIVSFVGKWGQCERKWVHCPNLWCDLQYGEWWGADASGTPTRYRSLGGVVQREEIGGLAADAVPSIAAWVLSSARQCLLSQIRCAGWGNTHYVDTDTIITNEAGASRLAAAGLVQECELGALQLRAVYDGMEIRGIKYYLADGRIVCSGLPKDRCEDAGDTEHYWYSVSPADQLRSGLRPEATRVLHPYHRSTEYRHGVVGPDGRVSPIRLEEW